MLPFLLLRGGGSGLLALGLGVATTALAVTALAALLLLTFLLLALLLGRAIAATTRAGAAATAVGTLGELVVGVLDVDLHALEHETGLLDGGDHGLVVEVDEGEVAAERGVVAQGCHGNVGGEQRHHLGVRAVRREVLEDGAVVGGAREAADNLAVALLLSLLRGLLGLFGLLPLGLGLAFLLLGGGLGLHGGGTTDLGGALRGACLRGGRLADGSGVRAHGAVGLSLGLRGLVDDVTPVLARGGGLGLGGGRLGLGGGSSSSSLDRRLSFDRGSLGLHGGSDGVVGDGLTDGGVVVGVETEAVVDDEEVVLHGGG
eukprot:PhM_4_TR7244/c0_g1_i1/m.42839